MQLELHVSSAYDTRLTGIPCTPILGFALHEMFSSLGLFKNIQCPQTSHCVITNCIFDHRAHSHRARDEKPSLDHEQDIVPDQDVEEPLSKRRRVEQTNSVTVSPTTRQNAVDNSQPSKDAGHGPSTLYHKSATHPPKQLPVHKSAVNDGPQKAGKATPHSQPKSATRAVSPPRRKEIKLPISTVSEKLAPRQVAKAPVPFKSRLSYLELLHKLVKDHNEEVKTRDSLDKTLVLEAVELIKLVLDDEEQAASSSSADLYKNIMSQRYLHYKNISAVDWESLVKEKFRSAPDIKINNAESPLSTGLAPAEEIELLRGLKTSVMGLEQYGYVTVPPTNAQIKQTIEAVSAAQGFEVCDRCGTRFQVFPGRDSQGRLTTQGMCYYHWARIPRTQTAKNARMFGQADLLYPCCNQPPGSEGCTKADSHVFKVTDPKRLASLLQFGKTPEQNQQRRQPVAFDCEMAYTTFGMELVRLTAISWPEKTELLDVLVRPYGEILDLNTRFSGVSQHQFANAATYDVATASGDRKTDADGSPTPLRKVDSPAIARQLLFDLLTPETPLIGHAIENDLNACRIVHPFIIDTVLLYPHPAGLPARYGLKLLASKYLQRGIQAAGAQGHDSKEDSIATGDLVRVKVADKWKSMKVQGWKFESSRLIAPTKPG